MLMVAPLRISWRKTFISCLVFFWPLDGYSVPAKLDLWGGALIQERGPTLPAGRLSGSSQIPYERAEGGDTPVLTFGTDLGPVRLLLDTGAAAAMVSSELLDRFNLASRPLKPNEFSLAGGGADCQSQQLLSTRLPELRLPAGVTYPTLRLRGLEAFVISGVALPKGVDGVLGVSSLRQLPFVVDPLQNKILLGHAALQWRRAMPGAPERLPLVWRRQVPLMQLRVRSRFNNQVTTLPALVDTGAEGLFLTVPLADTLTPLGPAQSARLVGACGLQNVLRQRLFGVALGPQPSALQGVEAILTSNPAFTLLGVEAIVGQELLRSRRQLWRLDESPPVLELW